MEYTDEQKARLFDALQADGVDNWEGYGQTNWQKTVAEIEAKESFARDKEKLKPLFKIIESSIEVDYPAGREAGARTQLTEGGILDIVMFISRTF